MRKSEDELFSEIAKMLIREIHFGNLGNPFGKVNGNPLAGL